MCNYFEKKTTIQDNQKNKSNIWFSFKISFINRGVPDQRKLIQKGRTKVYKVRGYLKTSRIVTLLLNLQLFPVKHAQFQLNGSLGNPHCDATTQDGNQNLKVNLTKKQKNINIFTYISRSH